MVLQVSFITVNLATVCLESYLYGIFFLLFASSTYFLISQGHQRLAAAGSARSSIFRAPMFIAANIIFCTVTGHWICTVIRLFDAFVNYKSGADPLYIYANLALMTEVVKSGLLVGTLAASDAMIIYRLYVIWGHNIWIVILPMLTWLALVVCGSGVAWQFSKYYFGEDVYTSLAGRWIISDCVFTFTTNLYCTALISWRVWRTSIRTKSYGGGNMMGALAIIVESALISTIWCLIFFVFYKCETNLQFTAIDLWSPISGIAFMMINLRVSLGWAQQAMTSQPSFSTASGPPLSPTHPFSQQPRPFSNQYPMQVVTVKVTQVVDRVRDSSSTSVMEKHDFEDDEFGQAV